MPNRILITGAGGFIGRNLMAELSRSPEQFILLPADIETGEDTLIQYLRECDFVVHLAGVNRPQNDSEFQTGNAGFTEFILKKLVELGNPVPIAMTSSIQAELDNAYGKSKLLAEQALLAYGQMQGLPVYAFRLPNVFGKWCRPNYNSAVATFCHNIARNMPVTVSDPARELTLVYIDDVLELLKGAIAGEIIPQADGYCAVPVTHTATLGGIVDRLQVFRDSRATIQMPNIGDDFDKKLYSTYLSYLASGDFGYQPVCHTDERGLFAEFFKTNGYGQFSISTTKPGIVRGNHWHHTKVEKFLVVSGEAAIRFRSVLGGEVITYNVSGAQPTVVDIPPGYTHQIENTSSTQTLVTVIWANEIFDPAHPDTYAMEV